MTIWSFFSAWARCHVVCCAPAVTSHASGPMTTSATTAPSPPRRLSIALTLPLRCLQHLAQERGRPRLPRPVEHLLRGSLLDDPALVQVHHAVRDLARKPHLVRDQEDGHPALGDGADHVQDLVHQLRVARGGRLAQEYHA